MTHSCTNVKILHEVYRVCERLSENLSALFWLFQTMCGQRFTLFLSVVGCTVILVKTPVISLCCTRSAGGRNWLTFWLFPRTRSDK